MKASDYRLMAMVLALGITIWLCWPQLKWAYSQDIKRSERKKAELDSSEINLKVVIWENGYMAGRLRQQTYDWEILKATVERKEPEVQKIYALERAGHRQDSLAVIGILTSK